MKKYSHLRYLLHFAWIVVACAQISIAQTTMEEVVAWSLGHNSSLAAQHIRIEQAQTNVASADVLPKTQIGVGLGVLPIETREGPVVGKLLIQQPLPWFGVLAKKRTVMEEGVGVRKAEYESYRRRFVYMVRLAFVQSWYSQQVVGIRKQDMALTDSYRQIALSRYEQGLGRMLDVVRANIKLQQDTLALATAESLRENANVQLHYLIQTDEQSRIDSLELPSVEWSELESLNPEPAHFLLGEIVAKEQEVAASIVAARAQDAPAFGVGLEYSLVDQKQYGTATSGGADALGVSVGVFLPIFGASGEIQAQSQRFALEALKRERLDLQAKIAMELKSLRLAVEVNRSALRVTDDVMEQTQLSLRLLKEEYSNSGKDFEQVLELQNVLLELQLRKQELMAEQVRLWAEFEYWRGG